MTKRNKMHKNKLHKNGRTAGATWPNVVATTHVLANTRATSITIKIKLKKTIIETSNSILARAIKLEFRVHVSQPHNGCRAANAAAQILKCLSAFRNSRHILRMARNQWNNAFQSLLALNANYCKISRSTRIYQTNSSLGNI